MLQNKKLYIYYFIHSKQQSGQRITIPIYFYPYLHFCTSVFPCMALWVCLGHPTSPPLLLLEERDCLSTLSACSFYLFMPTAFIWERQRVWSLRGGSSRSYVKSLCWPLYLKSDWLSMELKSREKVPSLTGTVVGWLWVLPCDNCGSHCWTASRLLYLRQQQQCSFERTLFL